MDRAYDWHYLAPNFSTYFRMMLVHLGVPQWQALFTPFGPTPWAKVRSIAHNGSSKVGFSGSKAKTNLLILYPINVCEHVFEIVALM